MSSNTLSTLSIGFVGDTKGLMGSVEESIGGVGRLAQTAGGILVPAFSQVNSASGQAEAGMGRLEQLIEVLGLRVMATSTQISSLAQASRRMGGASKSVKATADAATTSLQNEAIAARGLTSILSTLGAQAGKRQGNAGLLEVINEDSELSKIRRLRLEMTTLQQKRSREQTGQRITDIGGEVTQLTGQRDASHTNLAEKAEINQRINSLLAERIQLDIQLRSQLEAQDSTTLQISANQQQINALLRQSLRTFEEEKQAHQEILELKSRSAVPAKPQNLAQMKSEFKSLDSQIQATEKRWKNINKEMHNSVGDAERLKSLEADKASAAARLTGLRKKQEVSVDKILHAEKQSKGIEDQIAASLLKQQAVLSPKLAAEAKVTREKKEHKKLLMEAVRLEKITVLEAIKLGNAFNTVANKNLKAVNAGLTRTAKGTGKMNFAMQQFGFGIEDAASQMGTRGLAGAIGAASNNLTAMVGVLAKNPMTLVGVSIGVAITQLMIQTGALEKVLKSLGFEGESVFKVNEKLANSFDKVADASLRLLTQQKALRDLRAEMDEDAGAKSLQSLQDQLKQQEVEALRATEKVQREKDKKRLAAAKTELATMKMLNNNITEIGGTANDAEAEAFDARVAAMPALRAEIEALEAAETARADHRTEAEIALAKILQDQADTQERIAVAEGRQPELTKLSAVAHQKKLELIRAQVDQERLNRSSIGATISLERELNINVSRRNEIQKEMRSLRRSSGGTEELQLSRAKRALTLEKELTGLKKNRERLDGVGDTAVGKAEDILSKAKERAGFEESEDQRRAREQEKYVASLDKALQTKRITLAQQREALVLLQKTHSFEKNKERLERNKKLLKEVAKANADIPQVQSAVEAGSAEAMAIVNQAAVDDKTAQLQEPLIALMEKNVQALKDIDASIKNQKILNLKKKN